MKKDNSNYIWVMVFFVWGIPLIIWILAISFEWSNWQLIILAILKYILPAIGITLYVIYTEK